MATGQWIQKEKKESHEEIRRKYIKTIIEPSE